MKYTTKFLCAIGVVSLLASCATSYEISSSSINQTHVELTSANFNNLGSYSGNVTEKKMKAGIKNMEGIISRAKKDLIENARKDGVELTGSRTLTNVSVDVMKNWRRMTVTISAEIIEFTK